MVAHTPLKRARLPVPPPSQSALLSYHAIQDMSSLFCKKNLFFLHCQKAIGKVIKTVQIYSYYMFYIEKTIEFMIKLKKYYFYAIN